MPGIDLGQPARHSLDVSNRLNEHGGCIDLKRLYETTTVRQDRFEPTGVIASMGANVITNVRGTLWDDDTNNIAVFPLLSGVPHGLRFKRIYAAGTDQGAVIIVVGQ